MTAKRYYFFPEMEISDSHYQESNPNSDVITEKIAIQDGRLELTHWFDESIDESTDELPDVSFTDKEEAVIFLRNRANDFRKAAEICEYLADKVSTASHRGSELT